MTDFDASGSIYDLTLAQYLADPCETPSAQASNLLRLIELSPLHAWLDHPRLGGQRDQLYRRLPSLGTVVHALLLGKGGDYEVIDPADYPNKDGKIPEGWKNPSIRAARDDAIDRGFTPLLTADFKTAEQMVEAARNQLAQHDIGLFTAHSGKAEQTLIWEEDGVLCRCCVDWLPDPMDCIINVKTTDVAQPDHFQRRMFQMGYDFTSSHHLSGVRHVFGRDVAERFVVIERKPPYALSVIELSASTLSMAERKRKAALRFWRNCLEYDNWPAYPRHVCTLEAPAWQIIRQEERHVAGHYDESMLEHLLALGRPIGDAA